MVNPKIVLLIFVSGKIVLTGAKVREEIYRAFEVGFDDNVSNDSQSTRCLANSVRTRSLLSRPRRSRQHMAVYSSCNELLLRLLSVKVLAFLLGKLGDCIIDGSLVYVNMVLHENVACSPVMCILLGLSWYTAIVDR